MKQRRIREKTNLERKNKNNSDIKTQEIGQKKEQKKDRKKEIKYR